MFDPNKFSGLSRPITRLGLIEEDLYLGPVALGSCDDPDRIFLLTGLALGQPAPSQLATTLAKALADWRHGDKALANIRLALFPLPPARPDAASLIALSRRALDGNFRPHEILRALDLDPVAYGLRKYSPNQPRVPGGQQGGGEFAGPGLSVAFAEAPPAPGAAAGLGGAPEASFIARLVEAAPEAPELFAGITEFSLEALGAFAAGFALSTAVFGALILTTRETGGVSEGEVPGTLGATFRSDMAAGRLTLTVPGADGAPLAVVAGNDHGVYVDRDGRVIGIWKDGRFILDQRQVAAALAAEAHAAGRDIPEAVTRSLRDEGPNLCPAAQDDRPHRSTPDADAYEGFMHFITNPHNPLKVGQGIHMRNPMTGNDVVFDDCRRSDGHLLEFKGPGFADQIKKDVPYFPGRILAQARRQIQASGGRPVEWYFHEKDAADYFRGVFHDANLNISVYYVPMPGLRDE